MSTHFLGGLSMRPIAIAAAETARTLQQKDSGRVMLIPDLAANLTFTLPAAEDGLSYRFTYIGTAADAHDWVINTASTSTLYKGGVMHADYDGDTVDPIDADQSDDDTFTVNNPFVGTDFSIVSDGTSWYVHGTVGGATAPAFS